MEFDLAMNMQGFIGTRVLPAFSVPKKSGNYGKIPIKQLLQKRETRRGPGGVYTRGKFTFEPMDYACKEHGAEEPIDDQEAEMYVDYFDHELVSTARAYSAVLLNQEMRIAAKIFNTTTYSGSSLYTDASDWSNASGATPIEDVLAASEKVWQNTGLWANALIVNRFGWRDLIRTDDVIDAIQAAGAGQPAKIRDITTDMVARALDLDMVLVADSSKNTADEGQTAVIEQVWSSSYAMICRICTSNDIREPGLGRTFHWDADGASISGAIETYREEQTRSEIVRVRHDVDEKVHYVECGHLIKID